MQHPECISGCNRHMLEQLSEFDQTDSELMGDIKLINSRIQQTKTLKEEEEKIALRQGRVIGHFY